MPEGNESILFQILDADDFALDEEQEVSGLITDNEIITLKRI